MRLRPASDHAHHATLAAVPDRIPGRGCRLVGLGRPWHPVRIRCHPSPAGHLGCPPGEHGYHAADRSGGHGAYALGAWLTPGTPERARQFARNSAIGALVLGMLGLVVYHLLAASHAVRALWPVVALVSCLPVIVLGSGAALTHLLQEPAAESGLAPEPAPVSALAGTPVQAAEPAPEPAPAKPAPKRAKPAPGRAKASTSRATCYRTPYLNIQRLNYLWTIRHSSARIAGNLIT
jgi:hypothetical protein